MVELIAAADLMDLIYLNDGTYCCCYEKTPPTRSDLEKIMRDPEIEKGTMVSRSVRCYRSQYT